MFPPRLFFVYCLQLLIAFLLSAWLCRKFKPAELIRQKALTPIFLLIFFDVIFYTLTNLFQYWNFATGAVDLATISQSLWNISRGVQPFETILGTHSLRVHFSLVWYLVAPIFRLCPNVGWLFFLSAFCASLGGLFIFASARCKLQSNWLALALAASFLLNPYFQRAQLAAAHAEHFGSLFIYASLYFLIAENWPCFVIFGLMALGGKEDVGIYFFGLGYYLWKKKKRGLGLATALVGLTWSLSAYLIWMPHFGPDTQNLISRYSDLGGDTPKSIIASLVYHPWNLFLPLLHWEKLFDLFYFFAQTAFCAFFAGAALLPLLFSLALKSLSNNPGMYHFWDHYSLNILPFFYFASILGLLKLKIEKKEQVAVFLLILTFLINLEWGNNPLSRQFKANIYQVSQHSKLGFKIEREIPTASSVLAQELLAPHFFNHEQLWAVTRDYNWGPGDKPLVLPDYAVFDLKGLDNQYSKDAVLETEAYFRSQPCYKLVADEDGWRLYQKLNCEMLK